MRTPEFTQLLTSSQSRLYAYILSLLFDTDQADDVLQQTNIELWKNEERFELGTNFIAWSFRIAYFQVLAHRKRKQRDRLFFDDELVAEIALVSSESDATFEQRQKMMRNCLEKLNDRQRELVGRRYQSGANIKKIANDMNQTIGAVKQGLFRARTALINCVRTNFAGETT